MHSVIEITMKEEEWEFIPSISRIITVGEAFNRTLFRVEES